MMARLLPLILPLVRGRSPVSLADAMRTGLGALLGLAFTGAMARFASTGAFGVAPLLIPPIGASAVLVFAIPASPLAQPRCVIGGNILSCLVGISMALLIPQPLVAAAAAVGVAILAMSLLGCLHPPGGAIALGAALVGTAGGLAGYMEELLPIVLCSVLITVAAAIYARLTGRSYPHRPAVAASPHATRDAPPARRVGYTPADLDAALAQYGELLDVSRDDLDALFQKVEQQTHRRIHAQIRCDEIMSRDVIAVHLEQSAASALAFLQQHDLRTAPVVDLRGRVVGIVRRAELLAARDRPVASVVDPFVHKVRPGSPIQALFPLLSTGATHEAMVVDENRVLQGIITQTDLLAVLYRAHVVEAVVNGAALSA